MSRVCSMIATSALVGALAACTAVGPTFTPPHETVPDAYAGAPAQPGAPDPFWWQQFHDPELDRLETLATAGNLDLQAAYLRIVASRQQVEAVRAQGLPSLAASAQYTREQLGFAGVLKSSGYNAGGATSASTQSLISSIEKPINLFQLGFDASWELDLFGRVRRSVEVSKAQSLEQVESRNDMLVSLRAEVAQTYFQLRAAQLLSNITRDLVKDQRDVVDLTRNSQQHGLAGEVDVDSAQAQLASLESQLPQYEQSLATARHSLAVLTGQPPTTFDREFGDKGALPVMPADVDVGVPSTLARRRPDIRQAEAALHAATAEVGVSVASMYPDISLSGSYGLRNLGTKYLFDWSSKFYTAGPKISLPIFDGGRLVANIRLSKAEAAVAALNYRQTVLSALQEVEDGLTALRNDAERRVALERAVASDQRAVAIDLDAYRRGLITYVTLLQQQLQATQARQQLTQAQLSQSTDLVKLYKALGGGWEDADSATGAPAPPG